MDGHTKFTSYLFVDVRRFLNEKYDIQNPPSLSRCRCNEKRKTPRAGKKCNRYFDDAAAAAASATQQHCMCRKKKSSKACQKLQAPHCLR